jgi:hypothetical protein
MQKGSKGLNLPPLSLSLSLAGASVSELCEVGDAFISEALAKVRLGPSTTQNAVCFPLSSAPHFCPPSHH